jgi:hypothetical protein
MSGCFASATGLGWKERHTVLGILGFVLKIGMLIQARKEIPVLLEHMAELVRVE